MNSSVRAWLSPSAALFGLLLALGGAIPASAQAPGGVFFPNPPQMVSPGQTFQVEWEVNIFNIDFILNPTDATGSFSEWRQTITFPAGVNPTSGGNIGIGGAGHTSTISGNSVTDDFNPHGGSYGLSNGPFTVAFQVAPAILLPPGTTRFTFHVHSEIISTTGQTVSGDNDITFPLAGAPAPTLSLALSPRTGRAAPGSTVHYSLTADASDTIQQLALQDTLPDPSIATLVPGSVTQGGQVAGNTIQWNLSGVSSVTVEFDVKVQDAQNLPKDAQAVTDAAHADATFSSGYTVRRDASSRLSLGMPQLTLEVVPKDSSGINLTGGKAHPGDTITIFLRATSTDPVNQLAVEFTLDNVGTIQSLVPGSITGGGQEVFQGQGVLWTFTSADSSLLTTGVLSFDVKLEGTGIGPGTDVPGNRIGVATADATLPDGSTIEVVPLPIYIDISRATVQPTGGTYPYIVTPPSSASPHIDTLSVDHGSIGQPVILYGSGFADVQGSSYVTVGGHQVPVRSWTAGAIYILADPLAYHQLAAVPVNSSLPVQVIAPDAGTKSNTVGFFLTDQPLINSKSSDQPSMTGLSPSTACRGAAVTLLGMGFGADQGAGLVTVEVQASGSGGSPVMQEFALPVLSWSDSQISVLLTVPAGTLPGNAAITVRRDNGKSAAGTLILAAPGSNGCPGSG